jgi:hypothetical protein
MALHDYGGFEGVTAAQLGLDYDAVSGNAVLSSTTNPAPPNGTALTSNAGGFIFSVDRFIPATATGFFGVRILHANVGATPGNYPLFQLLDSAGNSHLIAYYTVGGFLEVYRGNNTTKTLLGTSATGVSNVAWYYLEIGYTISDTVGAVTLKLNGTTVLTLASQDTRNGGTADVSIIRFVSQGNGSTNNAAFDDWYSCDTIGSAPYNTFLGAQRVLEILPDAPGDSTQFTPSAGANWQCVDDVTHNSDTDYVESITTGHIDRYSLVNPPLAATTILAVRIEAVARFVSGARNVKIGVKSGASVGLSATQALSGSYAKQKHTLLVDPASGTAFTQANLNAMLLHVEAA